MVDFDLLSRKTLIKGEELLQGLFKGVLTDNEIDRFNRGNFQTYNPNIADAYKGVVGLLKDAVVSNKIKFRRQIRFNRLGVDILIYEFYSQDIFQFLESEIIPYMKAKRVEPSREMVALIQALKVKHPVGKQEVRTKNTEKGGKAAQSSQISVGKKSNPIKASVQEVARRLRKGSPKMSAKEIVNRIEIIKILAPNQPFNEIKDASDDNFQKICRVTRRTVRGWIYEIR